METRTSRKHALSSPSSISDSEKRSISLSPRRGPSTPMKSSRQRDESEDEQDPNDRDSSPLANDSKPMRNEPSSPTLSDTEENHEKKRKHHHRHHHHHHHHKQSKSNKRSATHHKHSVKRSKKETVTEKSDDENSVNSSEKNTSESEQSLSEQEIISSDNQSANEDEEIIKGENRTHSHRKKSSNREQHSSINQSSSTSIPKNNKGTQLIVNYLPASLRESDFYQLFARIAPIKLCKLITDRNTGHSFCYGFIEYHSKEDAIKAIEKYNGYRIEHKKLKVSYAQPKSNNNIDEIDVNPKHLNTSSTQKNANIYITDLPDDFDEKMLQRLFSKYGEIIQTKILRDPRTKISRGVGFVLMTSTRYAERAVKALDGHVPSGTNRAISVKFADPKKTAMASQESTPRLPSSSSMLTPIGPYGYPPGLPSMSMIDPYYAANFHHHRATMNMRNLSPSPPPLPPPSSSYYGSRNHRSSRVRGSSPGLPRSYSSSKHTPNILTTTMNNSSSSLNSSNLSTTTSLAAACDLISKGCQQAIDPNGFVIYAFGLPHDCEENDLEDLFRRYGEVHRVYIVRNYSTGESKGYSFVTMKNYNEACHAVDRLDGSTFQGRTIQVRFKQ